MQSCFQDGIGIKTGSELLTFGFQTHLQTLPLPNPDSLGGRYISRWVLNLGNADADILRAIDWNLLQTSLLRLEPVPTLVIRSSNEGAFRWLLETVRDGDILGPALLVNQLQLLWDGHYWPNILGTEILSTEERHMIEGSLVILNPTERFELLLRTHLPHEYGDPNSYLLMLLRAHNSEFLS